MTAAPEVRVQPSADELGAYVAAEALGLLAEALAARGSAHLVITGGGILETVLRAVRDSRDRDTVDWRRVHIWWGDERYVEADSDDRNDEAAFRVLLGDLDLDPARVHRMPSLDDGFPNVEAAAESYAHALAEAAPVSPRFDVVLLGIGPDGHCASLFPGYPGVLERVASVIGVRDSPKPPALRISLTLPALDSAREIWFIASGQGKAHAVAAALGGADPAQVPSAGPRGLERTLWLLDADAAAELPQSG